MSRLISISIAVLLSSPIACGSAPTESSGASSAALSSGSSVTAATACSSNADCSATEYCVAADGQCGGAGTCTSRGIGRMCMTTVTPVCGCDQNTYRNPCEAAKAGVALASRGACYLPPSAFLMQFADTYDVTQPSATNLVTLTLDPRGSYSATFADGSVENGAYTSRSEKQLPVSFFLTNGSNWWSGRITDNSGAMTITRDNATDTATPEDAVGPNESLCDQSGGSWTDDEVDPSTGLFCVCPAGMAYVPSQGGCTPIE